MDVFVVQSTVSTVRHISTEYKTLDLAKFCADDEGAGDRWQHGRRSMPRRELMQTRRRPLF